MSHRVAGRGNPDGTIPLPAVRPPSPSGSPADVALQVRVGFQDNF